MTNQDSPPGREPVPPATAAPFGRIPVWVPFVTLSLGAGVVALRNSVLVSPGDLPAFAAAGAEILQGRLAGIYADSWMQAGPLEMLGSLVVWFRGGRDGGAWGDLVNEHGYRPWHAVFAVAAVLVLWAAIRRARRANGLADNAWPVLVAIGTGLLLRLPSLIFDTGHLAQLVIPFWWVWAATLARQGRGVRAALLLGLACGWEPWAFLAAPVLLLDPTSLPRRPTAAALARPVLIGGVFLAAAVSLYLPFAATGSFTLFDHDWPVIPDSLVGSILGRGVHFSWPLRLLQGGVTLTAGAVLALLLRRRTDAVWLVPFMIQAVRLLLDPLDLGYYWTPLLVLGLFGIGLLPALTMRARLLRVLVIAVVPHLAGLLLYVAPLLFINRITAPSPAATAGLLVALLGGLDLIRLQRRNPGRRLLPRTAATPPAVPAPRGPADSTGAASTDHPARL